jgi:hypothetical protein
VRARWAHSEARSWGGGRGEARGMIEAERGWRRWGSRDEAWGREGSAVCGTTR